MMGTIWIHAGVGLVAFVVTLLVALTGNVWLVALERAGIAFLVFFLAAFPVRWVLAKVTQTPALPSAGEGEAGAGTGEAPSTNGSEKRQEREDEEGFSPFSLSQFEKIRPIEDPTTVAEVVRRLTDE
ncbi:hypothetical protein ACFSO0_15455 [Brevibacillus sp. GCM10020057]|uniref:hypothetical protein n=1 Tax=Brevibacillus sp. GCM10020057 TaxID=3317327 RepID=UPI003629BA33